MKSILSATRATLLRGIAGALLTACAATTAAAAYPDRPVRFIVPFTPGATLDLMTRAVAEQLSTELHQPVVVENRPGASGIIGAEATAKAAPDGYVYMMAPFSVLAVNASLHKNIPYDNLRDFAPVALVAQAPHILLASTQAPFKTLREFIAYAKANPGKVSYASAGAGSSAHLATEVLRYMTGVEITHIPYKGTAPAYTDLIPNRVSLMVDGVGAAVPRVQSGQVRALGVTSTKRVPVLPDVPTLAESGAPGYDVTPWYGLVAPRGTPPGIVDAMNHAVLRALKSDALQKRFAELGLDPLGSTPAEFGQYLASETEKWKKVVRDAHVTVD
ncbi:tripartite tricarboxylate transporter substrate binding protein [Bordetella genomosp. 13]|uniref:tripartite tricarboxylate transporter substrate binding protein n=1 Tax=Bordetella genomosp. 13 TaxID=463040 RepID=UPI0011A8FE8C|nr:tripartite tricarboxylate transporter substrate binding protein [Bordetella genomosp. 13]